jgi:uncharacterized protein (TIGR03435 family)
MRGAWIAAVASVLLISARPLPAQAPESPGSRTFDVASVKPNTSGGGSSQRFAPNGTMTLVNNTLRNIIRTAHGLQGAQVVGGPDWLDTDRFDVLAKANAPFTTDEGRVMLRALVAERFGVVTHSETRDLPVFLLRVLRSDRAPGIRLKPSVVDCTRLAAAQARVPCGLNVSFAAGSITGAGVSMSQLARNLMGVVGRTIVDETGLSGVYDLELTFAPDASQPRSDAPSLFTALQEQLGLKLEAGREPIPVLVIDRASRPAAD